MVRTTAVTGAVGGAVAIGGCVGGTAQPGGGGLGEGEDDGGQGGGTGGDASGSGGEDTSGGSGGDATGGDGDGVSGGSGGDDTGGGAGGTQNTGGALPECEQGLPLYVHGLMPAEDPAYIGLHTFHDELSALPYGVADSVGTLCEGASDPDACTSAATNPDPDVAFDECGMIGCSATLVVSTEGDDVEQYATMEELLAFLGTIDTPQEALLVARYAGYMTKCDGYTTVTEVVGGYEVVVDNTNSCDSHYYRWTLRVTTDGKIEVVAEEDLGPSMIACGRRPAGLLSDGNARTDSAAADYFAACVHLERAAVHAFESMTLELLHHGAPAHLIAAARRSADEEREHTRLAAALCARSEAPQPEPRMDDVAMRDLMAMARENVVEGCVRETFGALLAHHQAAHAMDPDVAAAMRTIAEDETRHAALAWDVAAWIEPQLSGAQRAELDRLRCEAVAQLAAEMTRPLPEALTRDAGLPPAEVAAAMIARLRDELWA